MWMLLRVIALFIEMALRIVALIVRKVQRDIEKERARLRRKDD